MTFDTCVLWYLLSIFYVCLMVTLLPLWNSILCVSKSAHEASGVVTIVIVQIMCARSVDYFRVKYSRLTFFQIQDTWFSKIIVISGFVSICDFCSLTNMTSPSHGHHFCCLSTGTLTSSSKRWRHLTCNFITISSTSWYETQVINT